MNKTYSLISKDKGYAVTSIVCMLFNLFVFSTLPILNILPFTVNGQCVSVPAAPDPSDGGTIAPVVSSTFQDFTNSNQGPNRFFSFSATSGRIYSFRTLGGSNWQPYLTITNASNAVQTFNAGNGPYYDDNCGTYTAAVDGSGGEAAASLDWVCTSTGTYRVHIGRNTGTGAAPACNNNWFSGNGSATLQYREVVPPTDAFGANRWRVYAYNGANRDIVTSQRRLGYFEMPTSTLSFNSTAFYTSASTPSSAIGWVGAEAPIDNHTVVYKRQGFDCGYYSVRVLNHDDDARMYVNGVQVWDQTGCCVDRGIVWSGLLNSSSTVEFRVQEGCGGSELNVAFNKVDTWSPTSVSATPNPICQGATLNLASDITGTCFASGTGSAVAACVGTYNNLCSSADFIDNFSTTRGFTNITRNATGCNGNANNYIDYSSDVLTVLAGQSFDISVQSGASWGQGFIIWIDYNNDGAFSASESVWASSSSGTGVYTGTITVPTSQTAGIYRMRVRCLYAAVPGTGDACTNLSFGETEDYRIQVNGQTPCSPTYSWSGPGSYGPLSGQNQTRTNIAAAGAGVYTVSITAGGCTQTANTADVNVLSPNAVRNAPTGPQCSGTTLNFTSTPTGGNGTYTYAWSATDPATTGSSNTFSYAPINTTAANITPTVTLNVTSNSLTCSQTFNPTIYPVPVLSTTLPNITYCNTESTIAIALAGTPSGVLFNYSGTGPNIGLANGTGVSAIPWFTATNAGNTAVTRTITVTPTANSCSGTGVTFDITVNPTNKITTNLTNKSYCHNETAPAISLVGTPSGVTYDVSGGASVGLNDATGLTEIPSFTAINNTASPITVTVTVTPQANGCPSTAETYDITVNPTPTFTTAVTPVTCNGLSTGVIVVTPTVGTSPFDYSKNNGGAYQGSNTFNLLAANNYDIVIRDDNGCFSAPQTVAVGQPNVLTATATNGGPYSTFFTAQLNANQAGGTAPYGYNWSGPASFAPGNVQNPTRNPTAENMTGTYRVTVTDVNGCTASASTVMNVYDGYIWDGSQSTDWTDPDNWTHQAATTYPSLCDRNAIIPFNPLSPNPVPNVNVPTNIGSLVIENGGAVNLNNDLQLCGSLTGSLLTPYSQVTGSGKLVLVQSLTPYPTVVQKINGKTRIETLQIDNAAGVEIAGGNTQIHTALELKSGNLKVANATRLTFLSDNASHSAVLDNFSSGFTGTFMNGLTPSVARAQRSYNAQGNTLNFNFHHTSSPFNNLPTIKFGANGTPGYLVNTACSSIQSTQGSPYGNVQLFDEASPTATACWLQSWKTITAATQPTLVNGQGYAVRRNGAGTLTVDGSFNINSTYTLNGLTNSNWSGTTAPPYNVSATSGSHMLGNPYLAYLDLSKSSGANHNANAGFTAFVYVWNIGTASFDVYDPSTDLTVIPPFGTFWVKKTAGAPANYTINGNDRTRTETATFNKQNIDHVLNITAVNTATGLLDKTRVSFSMDAEAAYQPQTDAEKMLGAYDRHSLYTNIGNLLMARNMHKSVEETSTIPMGFYVGATGSYELSFDGINTFDPTSYVYVEDKTTGTMHNVRNGNYSFTANITDAQDRFVLHFTPKAEIQAADATCQNNGQITIEQPGAANWNYTITDNATNATMAQGTLNSSNPVAVAAPSGVYNITLTDNNGYQVIKNVQVNGQTPIAATMTANTNTAEVDETITLNNTTTGATNQTWDMGNSVQFSTPMVNYSYPAEGVYTVTLSTINADGCASTTTQTITVTQKTTTSLNNLTKDKLKVWSYENKVMVDFTKQPGDAVVIIYNLLGQEISNEPYTGNGIYSKALNKNEASYVVIRVTQDDKITTKKLFIKND